MIKIFKVEEQFSDMRIDRFIKKIIKNLPQGLIEKNLRNGKIKLNNKKVKSSQRVKKNDLLNFYNVNFYKNFREIKNFYKPSKKLIKSNEKLIIEDNDNFVVINKDPGISVQGGTKSNKNLIDIFRDSRIFENTKPYSVHRLDKDTSGIFLIAKNRKTAQLLTSLFRLRRVHKTYLAICHGSINNEKGILKNILVRYDNNKKVNEKAETVFKVIDKNSFCSLVEMKPITGRKHQLRKQMLLLGHPIVGDSKYNLQEQMSLNKNKHLMLHSNQIKFMINNEKYTYTAPLPKYFENYLKVKRLRFQTF
tara:strand:- start:212 stop:1129 length:918 start_codon:yes stop_codon:yes gene_type:complete